MIIIYYGDCKKLYRLSYKTGINTNLALTLDGSLRNCILSSNAMPLRSFLK